MAPVLKILGIPRLPPGGSLGTGKRGTVQKIWRAVPIFFSACKWGLIQMDSIKVQEKEKKIVVLCSRPTQSVKLGRFTPKSCDEVKEMY